MANENNSKDVANSLNGYSNTINKGTNALLDSANQINKWYSEQVNKIVEVDNSDTRFETGVDNSILNDTEEKISKIETKVENYTEIQTNNRKGNDIIKNTSRLKTQMEDETLEDVIENESNSENLSVKKNKITKKIATAIKGAKIINNTANKFVKTGKTINTATNEGGLKSFENSSNRIMTKPVRKVVDKATSKATNKLGKTTKKFVKNNGEKIVKSTVNLVEKTTRIIAKLVAATMKMILSMLPSIAPIIIIILIIAAIGNFLNLKTSKEADNINFDEISSYMIQIGDPNLQAIYNEFLKNMGKPYLMDHSNLSHDTCMDTYDCSSFVIHCLSHTGIKTIPDTTASGLYSSYCNPIEVNDRKAGDLIFLKDTYDTGTPGGISHVGIYMGTLTINGDTGEWVIDTGGNPEGVKIRKYNIGWWNGSNFYGFGRLK